MGAGHNSLRSHERPEDALTERSGRSLMETVRKMEFLACACFL